MSDNSLYTRLLLPKRHGYPISCPTPYGDAPLEARRAGTEIGDVGVIMSDGSFDVIFNICRASDDPINRFGVPRGFEQVHVGPEDVASLPEFHDPGSHVSNATINKRRLGVDASAESNVFLPLGAGAVVEISTSSKEAAVLLLPDGASRVNLRPLKEFRDYAIKHAQCWYEFVNGNLRRMVENGDLYLVTGMDKTSSWSIAAAENQSEDGRISLTLKAAQVGAAHASYIWEWEAASSFAACGPRRPPEEQSWGQNQTVFLRGYKVAIRSIPLKKSAKALSIVNSKASDILSKSGSVPFSGPPSGSGFSSFFRGASASGQGSASDDMGSPPSSDSSGASDKEELVEYFPHTTKSYHPGCAINEYMLSSTVDAMVAVTHDEEWMSLLNEDDEEIPQDCELIRRILYKYNIEGAADGVWLTMLNEEVSNPEAHPEPFTPAEPDLDLGQDPVLNCPPDEKDATRATPEALRIKTDPAPNSPRNCAQDDGARDGAYERTRERAYDSARERPYESARRSPYERTDSPASSSRTPLSPQYRLESHPQSWPHHRPNDPATPSWYNPPQAPSDPPVRLRGIASLLGTEPYPQTTRYDDRQQEWPHPHPHQHQHAPQPQQMLAPLEHYPPMVAPLPLDDSRARSPQAMPQRNRGRLPKETTDFLKAWLHSHAAHPYPSEIEKKQMCHATGLSMSQVSNWMINGRRRILGPSYLSTSRANSSQQHNSPPVQLSSPAGVLQSPSVLLTSPGPSLMLRTPSDQ